MAKNNPCLHKTVFLLLIGWLVIQVAGISFVGAGSYQDNASDRHARVKPLSTSDAAIALQFAEIGEEVSEEDRLLWRQAISILSEYFVSFSCVIPDVQSVIKNPVGVHLPLYLLHHCLRIPPHL